MKRRLILNGLLVGLVVSLPALAIFYLASQLTDLPFVPFDVFNWIARVLPGPLITFGIDSMIDTMRLLGIDVADNAKTAEQTMAIMMVGLPLIVTSVIYAFVIEWRQFTDDRFAGTIMGLLVGLPIAGIVTSINHSGLSPVVMGGWIVLVFLLWGLALSTGYRRLSGAHQDDPEGEEAITARQIARRQFLIQMGTTSAAITVVGSGVGLALAGAERRRLEGEQAMGHEDTDADSVPMFPNSNDPVMPAPGTRPEYTPVKDHYKVFLETEPSFIDGAMWQLPITGLVQNPVRLTVDDLKNNYTEIEKYVTLSCISGRVGTGLIGTTLWTGVSVKEVLEDIGLQPNAQYLDITCEDGFHETVDIDLIMSDERIMFCHSWDGQPLPYDHGFPLRIYIPDRYGMKQPKWITGIEVTDAYREGYWVERGWSETAIMNATSVIDTVAVNATFEKDGQTVIPIGGIAHAGARSISKVEVRMDGGEWSEAELRSPLSEVTWVVWRYDWPFDSGRHTFEVRCVEGDGETRQIEEEHKARPDGSTGIHSYDVSV